MKIANYILALVALIMFFVGRSKGASSEDVILLWVAFWGSLILGKLNNME